MAFPQKRQQECRTTPWLVYRPQDLFGQRESFVYEPQDVRLVVLDLPGEQLCARRVQHVSPVDLFADVYARPGLVHHHLRRLLVGCCPRRTPPTTPYIAKKFRRSLLAVKASTRDRGAILLKPSIGRYSQAILDPYRRHPGYVPERLT